MNPIAAWFLYSMVVANVLGLAAVAGESALRGSGRPGRWAWVAAMLASVILPLLAWSGLSLRSVPSVPASVMIPIAPVAIPQIESVVARTPDLGDALGWAWLALSAAVVVFAILSWLSVRRERRGWDSRRIGGVHVMVTRDRGPAVYGLRRAEILLPEWALRLELRVRRLMLLHEGEHAIAGDTRLVVLGLVVVAAAPWNLPLWWQLKRLREAIELDCDARVLRRAPDARQYGALLLEVGRRRAAPVLGVALAEPVSLLERRIRQITARAKRATVRRVVSLGGLALMLSVVAVCTRDPMAPAGILSASEVGPAVAKQGLALPTAPLFTVAPRVVNPTELAAAIEANYPPLLRSAAVSGVVEMWFHVDETGAVDAKRIGRQSGYPALDEAALRVADRLRFSPALNDEVPVSVWVAVPIRFAPDPAAVADAGNGATDGGPPQAGESPARPPAADIRQVTGQSEAQANVESATGTARPAARPEPDLDLTVPVPMLASDNSVSLPAPPQSRERGPTFTPFTHPPRLVNAEDAGRAMEREYPVLLRTSGVGGTVKVWFHIDAQGRVLETVVGETSGFASLDDAALRVARVMVFQPARNGADPVASWVSLPIKFSTR